MFQWCNYLRSRESAVSHEFCVIYTHMFTLPWSGPFFRKFCHYNVECLCLNCYSTHCYGNEWLYVTYNIIIHNAPAAMIKQWVLHTVHTYVWKCNGMNIPYNIIHTVHLLMHQWWQHNLSASPSRHISFSTLPGAVGFDALILLAVWLPSLGAPVVKSKNNKWRQLEN